MMSVKNSVISLAVVAMLGLYGCGGGNGNNQNNTYKNKTKLKGNFNTGTHMSFIEKVFSIFSTPVYAFEINKVAKVIALNHSGSYNIADVNDDGSFEVDLITNDPTVIIFASASNRYLGYLTLSNGIDSIPSHLIKEDTKDIDVGELDTNDTEVAPKHTVNLSDFINADKNEQSRIKSVDDILAIRAKNADMDGNGIVDLLENKNYKLSLFVTYQWNVNANNQVDYTNNNDTKFTNFNILLHTFDKTPPSNIYFTGPSTTGLIDSQNQSSTLHSDGNNHYDSPSININGNNYIGSYTINYDGISLNFNLPNLSELSKNLILPKPSFIFNNSNQLTEINWMFQTLSGYNYSSVAKKLNGKIGVQIYDVNGSEIFRDYSGDGTKTVVNIPNIDRASIGKVSIRMSDQYGTNYSCEFLF